MSAVASFIEGRGVIGLTTPHLPQASLRSYQGIVPKTEDWRLLGTSEDERAYLEGIEEGAESTRDRTAAAE